MNKINFSSHIGAHSNHGAHSSIHTWRKKRDIMTFAVGNNPAVSKRDAFRPQRGSFVDSIFSFVTWPPRETAQVEVKVRNRLFFVFTLLLSSCRPAFLSLRSVRPKTLPLQHFCHFWSTRTPSSSCSLPVAAESSLTSEERFACDSSGRSARTF